MKNKLENLYLDYFNHFLSIECFAEYLGIDEDRAKRVIEIGRKLNHRRSK